MIQEGLATVRGGPDKSRVSEVVGGLFKPDETWICAKRAETPITLHMDCVNSICTPKYIVC